jgi:WhiB family redox-sensing transcriptional regulator
MNEEKDEYFAKIARELDDMQPVPTELLSDLVTRDGTCMLLTAGRDELELAGSASTEREFAEQVCAGCAVRNACLELEFRAAGYTTIGIWGALAEDDRRAVYLAWSQRRQGRLDGGQP